MFENNNQKKMIIVCDEETIKYANYLLQLIGSCDDEGEKIIGVKDGSVEATVWTENDYIANRPKLSSNTYIVFIGDSKLIKNENANMEIYFDKYGMCCGWLGKRATINVRKKHLNKKEYDEFIEFGKKYQKNFEQAKLNVINSAPKTAQWIALFPYVTKPIALYGIISRKMASKKIWNQQFTLLILIFYMDALQNFLKE